MTLELILVRHAKSSWDDPLMSDHDRVLTGRGRRSADAIGAWLKVHEMEPDVALVSTAARAVETWQGLAPHIGDRTTVRQTRKLYHAAPRQMLDVLGGADGERVLMIGHNPGIAMFAAGICQTPSAHPDFNRYPTCATVLMRFDIDSWCDVSAGSGDLFDFIVPKQLLG